VFADDITIEDDMSVLVRYDNGANMTYHLTAYSVRFSSFFTSFPLDHSTHIFSLLDLPLLTYAHRRPSLHRSSLPSDHSQSPKHLLLLHYSLPSTTISATLASAGLTNSHGKDTGSCSMVTKADSN
jgi:hypothetical protein